MTVRKRGIASSLFHQHRFMPHGSNPDTDHCLHTGCTRRRPPPGAPPVRSWKQVARAILVFGLLFAAVIVAVPALPFIGVVYLIVRLADWLSGLEVA